MKKIKNALVISVILGMNFSVANASVKSSDLVNEIGPVHIAKFDSNREANVYRGNSLIAHIERDSDLANALLQVKHDFQNSEFSDDFIYLPKNSYHVTIFNGTNENPKQRKLPLWPSDVPLSKSIYDVHMHFALELKKAIESRKLEYNSITFITKEIKTDWGFPLLIVEPKTKEDKENLLRIRASLKDVLKIERPDYNNPLFHVSMAYKYKKLSSKKKEELNKFANKEFELLKGKEFTVNNIEFVLFDDMLSFSPLVNIESLNL
ncbi:DUF1868 domain-containing protein [Vibrio mediterranei]